MSAWKTLRKHRALSATLICAGLLVAWLVGRRVVGPRVIVEQPGRTSMVHSVVTTGRVRPLRVRLAPIASGTIRELPVREGVRVAAGQLLMQLDDEEASAALANAQALLAQARAGRKKIRTVTRAESAEALRVAQTQLEDAARDLERVRKMYAGGAVTRERLENAETTYTLAESALRSAKAQQQDLKSGGATVRTSEADIDEAQANVALAQARLEYTRLVAPADGIIIARNAEVGDAITATTVVLELAAIAKTELVVEPDERNLSLLAIGQTALASAEAFPDQTFEAQVSFIAPVVDSRRGTIEVRLIVPDPPAYLRPDMTVSVDIEVGRKSDALVVPIGAVQDLASDKPYVLVVMSGRVERRDIEVGIRDTENVEVLSGLDPLEQVILEPGQVSIGKRVRARVANP